MTYLELYEDALRKLHNSLITLGEFEMMVEPLNREVEAEPKTGHWIPVTEVYKPKADEFPNMHIEWEDATEPDEIDALKCSECGEVFDFADARNWCTQCGADMRKGGDPE